MKKQKKTSLNMDALEQAAECLRTLAHPGRLRMVEMLLENPHSVGELAEACDMAHNLASEHLRLMQLCGFLRREKQGRFTIYHINEPHLADIMHCIQNRFG